MVAKRALSGFGLALAAILAAAPAEAVTDFSPEEAMPSADIASHIAVDLSDYPLSKRSRGADAVAATPASTNWLLTVAGFGLLGAMNRRSGSDRLRDEMVF